MEWSQEIPDNTEKELIRTLTSLFRAGHMTKRPKLPDKLNISIIEDYKSDLRSIKKKAEHDLMGALVKFYHRETR